MDPDKSNLFDAYLLHAERVGHGYALLKHPKLIRRFKKKGICVELCLTSNEILGLCPNVRPHPFPSLLATGLQCVLSADNPGLFRSSLSHEFYQAMVGDTRMTIFGWKQLAQWSIEHSCLAEEDKQYALEGFYRDWKKYCSDIVDKFGRFEKNGEFNHAEMKKWRVKSA